MKKIHNIMKLLAEIKTTKLLSLSKSHKEKRVSLANKYLEPLLSSDILKMNIDLH